MHTTRSFKNRKSVIGGPAGFKTSSLDANEDEEMDESMMERKSMCDQSDKKGEE